MGRADYLKMGEWNAVCTVCQEEKDVSFFYIHSNGKPRKQCKSCHTKRGREWAKKNKEHLAAKNREYVSKNRELARKRSQDWRKRNLAYDAFRARTYKARKLKAIPSWANLEKIQDIYKNCPKGYHVDHIVPLKGVIVSGLHVENNLQYLPALENIRKRNFYGVC